MIIICIRNVVHILGGHFLRKVSCLLFMICAILFMVAFGANITHRIPIISDISDRISFPHKYELRGVIIVKDRCEPTLISIDVSVGGFSKTVYSNEEFWLSFISNDRDNIPLLVRYKYDGEEYTKIEWMNFSSDYILRDVYCYTLGE